MGKNRQKDVPAFAGLFTDTTAAESGETGRETVAAAAVALLLLRGRLLVLHGLLALWGTVVLALRGTILALGRTALRRAVGLGGESAG